jgi:SAM-dependent methyltransferase
LFGQNPRSREKERDDFDWTSYTSVYRAQISDTEKMFTLRIEAGDYEYRDGVLCKVRDKILPLHPNARLLYETILQLQPRTVVELGCGSGDHCRNLKVLNPNLQVYGYDRSEDQLVLLRQRNPELSASDFKQMDLTLPSPESCVKCDIAFTQAVIMHIHTGKGHLVALANAFRLATKQVILMENWKSHDFMDDIQALHKVKVIGWPSLYFHYRPSPERSNRPHLMVVSSISIRDYPTLSDDSILSDNYPQT